MSLTKTVKPNTLGALFDEYERGSVDESGTRNYCSRQMCHFSAELIQWVQRLCGGMDREFPPEDIDYIRTEIEGIVLRFGNRWRGSNDVRFLILFLRTNPA